MKLLSKTKSQKEAATAASLADRIKETCRLAEEYIETIVEREKAEHSLLSRGWIRQDLYLKYGKNCTCRCASALLELEGKK
jgi:hypothetical protein